MLAQQAQHHGQVGEAARKAIWDLLDMIQPVNQQPTKKENCSDEDRKRKQILKQDTMKVEAPRPTVDAEDVKVKTPRRKKKEDRDERCSKCKVECSCDREKKKDLLQKKREIIGAEISRWLQVHGRRKNAKVSAEERTMYMKLFNLLDEDGSGALDFGEISLALKLVGLKNSMSQIKTLVLKHGNQQGELDLNAFLLVIEESETLKHEQSENSGSDNKKAKNPHSGRNSPKEPRAPAVHPQSSVKSPLSRHRRLTQAQQQHYHNQQEQGKGNGGEQGDEEKDQAEEKEDEEEDNVLPFHLFLPAFSRKKNVEFVMNLELTEETNLPYPLDDAMFRNQAVTKTKLQQDLQPATTKCHLCVEKPLSLLDIRRKILKN